MKIARITGTLTATVKDHAFVGHKLLVADIEDGRGKVIEPSIVAVDACGAGVGDTVLVSFGSAARIPSATIGVPTDASVVAVVETISL